MRPYSSDPFRDNQRAASQSLSHLVKDGGQKMPSQFGTKPTLANTGLDLVLKARAIRQAQQEQDQARQALRQQERMRKVQLATKLATVQGIVQKSQPSAVGIGQAQTGPVSASAFAVVRKRGTHYCDYLIRINGFIVKKPNNTLTDRYYIETSSKLINGDRTVARQYKLLAVLAVNKYNLVNFPTTNPNLDYDRYGGKPEEGGILSGVKNEKKFTEYVGQGDHYLRPDVAAALFGVLNELHRLGLKVSLGDMSSSNGSDPANKGIKHHSGHGHMGNRSGLDIDFRYLDNNGTSYQGNIVDGQKRFNIVYNQAVYESAFRYGFDRGQVDKKGRIKYKTGNTYQGLTGPIFGVKKVGGHDDHGHLGFGINPINIINYEPYKVR